MASGPDCRQFDITVGHGNVALVAALRRFCPDQPWSRLRRWIHNRHVQVNEKLCLDEGRKLKAGDVIRLWQQPRPPLPRAKDVRIRYLDAHLVIVEKPAGVITRRHLRERDWSQRRRRQQPTLEEMVRQILVRQSKHRNGRSGRGRKSPSLRVVHRLDQDTSGLLAFARTAEAERRLVQMFRKHDVERVYLAIAHGRVREQTITSSLVRDRGDGLRGSTRLPKIGKRAVTHIRPLEYLNGYTLLECRLETGRTHQIRIHLAEAGHMVCGEKVYRHRLHGEPIDDRSGAPRQALHAAVLGLKHPLTGEPLKFEMPLPPDMLGLLMRLRGRE